MLPGKNNFQPRNEKIMPVNFKTIAVISDNSSSHKIYKKFLCVLHVPNLLVSDKWLLAGRARGHRK
jgi:hypothetical protein